MHAAPAEHDALADAQQTPEHAGKLAARRATAAADAATGRKHCRSCARHMPLFGGSEFTSRSGQPVWRCAGCTTRSRARIAQLRIGL